MSNVNWWLMALAFVLGVVLTAALTIRRVKREVPVYGALGRAPSAAAPLVDDATTRLPKAQGPRHSASVDDPTVQLSKAAPEVTDDATTKLPKATVAGVAVAGVAAAAAAGADKGDGDDKAVDQPYGTGSIRIAGSATGPEGYTVKGNEDSMLYHTVESPSYTQTIAEIWFVDEQSAIDGGFNRWDSGKSQRGK